LKIFVECYESINAEYDPNIDSNNQS